MNYLTIKQQIIYTADSDKTVRLTLSNEGMKNPLLDVRTKRKIYNDMDIMGDGAVTVWEIELLKDEPIIAYTDQEDTIAYTISVSGNNVTSIPVDTPPKKSIEERLDELEKEVALLKEK